MGQAQDSVSLVTRPWGYEALPKEISIKAISSADGRLRVNAKTAVRRHTLFRHIKNWTLNLQSLPATRNDDEGEA
jgi:hypothetical protein